MEAWGEMAIDACEVSNRIDQQDQFEAGRKSKGGPRQVHGPWIELRIESNQTFQPRFQLQTIGHLNVDLIGTLVPDSCDCRAAVMISTTCKACSGVNSGSRPVARHSATRDAPFSHT